MLTSLKNPAFQDFDVDIVPCGLPGLLKITPRKIQDERGYFSEIFRADRLAEHTGVVGFVQDNQSLSIHPGTIRGIHFQTFPQAQGKLVRCLAGAMFDVAVDLRRRSATFGRWQAVILSAEKNDQFWIPAGFGHAFCTLEPNSIVSYRVTNYYNGKYDSGIAWDDPQIGIEWPEIADPTTLSQRDRTLPNLCQAPDCFEVIGV